MCTWPCKGASRKKLQASVQQTSADRSAAYYNNINNQLDAIIILLLTMPISSTCFGR